METNRGGGADQKTAARSGDLRESKKESTELIPAMEGLVKKDFGRPLPSGSFSVNSDSESSIPKELLAPLFTNLTEAQNKEGGFEVKEIPTMGKAAFIENPTLINGIDYNFVQWKGVGRNAVNKSMPEKAIKEGADFNYPLGDKNLIPLFLVQGEGKTLLRFQGAAFYVDLLIEAYQSKKFESSGLRMPKILGTMKFSPEFCRQNNLPVPKNSDPNNYEGESLKNFVESHRSEIDPLVYGRMMQAAEFKEGYASATLGENLRAFRNVFRVEDLEKVARVKDETQRTKQLKSIIESSRRILSKELGRELSTETYLDEFSKLLGKQAAILVENRINQGAMKNHKQDITLAAEICDFDGAVQLSPENISKPESRPEWVTDETTMKEWLGEQNIKLDQQILLLVSHVKAVADAMAIMDGRAPDYDDAIEAFTNAIAGGLSAERRKELKQELGLTPDFSDIGAIAGKDQQTKNNLAGCQEVFAKVTELLRERL